MFQQWVIQADNNTSLSAKVMIKPCKKCVNLALQCYIVFVIKIWYTEAWNQWFQIKLFHFITDVFYVIFFCFMCVLYHSKLHDTHLYKSLHWRQETSHPNWRTWRICNGIPRSRMGLCTFVQGLLSAKLHKPILSVTTFLLITMIHSMSPMKYNNKICINSVIFLQSLQSKEMLPSIIYNVTVFEMNVNFKQKCRPLELSSWLHHSDSVLHHSDWRQQFRMLFACQTPLNLYKCYVILLI